ncbi:MAG: Ig-like domain-containing protein, partial [Clostridia bacterium]|nr:Ig-like domain-containing protein [Deltaproteobacteria bacterium]
MNRPTSTPLAQLLAFVLVATASSCSSVPTPTYVNITVAFDETIVVDQLLFETLQNNAALTDPVMRPETAVGVLSTDTTVTMLVPDSLAGKIISVRATGIYQGAEVTSGRVNNILPLPNRGVDVTIRLGHVLDSFTVAPASLSLALGAVQQLAAQGTFSDEINGDVTEQVTWTSSNESVASV